jgi:hypothetical protein
MPDIFTNLKSEFPSISDDDAMKAADYVKQTGVAGEMPAYAPETYDAPQEPQEINHEGNLPVMQQGPTPQQMAFDAASQRLYGAPVVSSSRQNAANEPKDPTASFGWMQYFPRLQGVYNNRMQALQNQQAQSAENDRFAQTQSNWQQDFGLRQQEALRQNIKFEQEQGKVKTEEDLRNSLSDPNSPETQIYRMLGKQMLPGGAKYFDQMNGARIAERFPSLNQAFNSINSRLEAQARLQDADLARQQTQINSDRAFQKSQDEKQEKKDALIGEIDERANNMLRAVNSMQDMIGGPIGPDGKTRSGGSGTAELLGPHEEILKGYINDVATEYSKMLDPQTGVRDPEVVRFMSTTFKPGNPFQSDKTAVELLENFKQKIIDRKKEAYSRVGNTSIPTGNSENVVIDTPKGRKTVPSKDVKKYLDAGAKLVQ